MDINSIMYKKNTYLFYNKDTIDEIFTYIINYLNKENITIINNDMFYSQLELYIYNKSFNAIKSKNNYSMNDAVMNKFI